MEGASLQLGGQALGATERAGARSVLFFKKSHLQSEQKMVGRGQILEGGRFSGPGPLHPPNVEGQRGAGLGDIFRILMCGIIVCLELTCELLEMEANNKRSKGRVHLKI